MHALQAERHSTSNYIGLFANNLHDDYNIRFLEGILKAVEENGYRLICFLGGSLNNPQTNRKIMNRVYNLASAEYLAGLLVLTSTIGYYSDQQDLLGFMKGFSPLPCLSLGTEVDGYHSAIVDNRPGMEDLMVHLMEVHKYKRIAFICGPRHSWEANERFQIYKNSLERYDIPFYEQLIVEGNFHAFNGVTAVRQLLDERNERFDALICVNDMIAINAIEELKRRGLQVPEEVAVFGFDDHSRVEYIDPPLTTVRQPLYELGFQATRALLELVKGQSVPARLSLPTRLVIRDSCGCRIPRNTMDSVKHEHGKNRDFRDEDSSVMRTLPTIENIIDRACAVDSGSGSMNPKKDWAKKLTRALDANPKAEPGEEFLHTLQNIIEDSSTTLQELDAWNRIVFDLFYRFIPAYKNWPGGRVVSLLNRVMHFIQNLTVLYFQTNIVKHKEFTRQLAYIKDKTFVIHTTGQLDALISNHFPHIGVKRCFIVVNRDCNEENDKQSLSMLVAFNGRSPAMTDDDFSRFEPHELLPGLLDGIEIRSPVYALTLRDKFRLLGYVIYEIENPSESFSAPETVNKWNLCELLTDYLTLSVINIQKQIDEQEEKETAQANTTAYNLPDSILQEYYHKLLVFMEKETPYLDPDLSLQYLAGQLDIPRNYLSFVINKYAKVHFNQFINNYRIKKATEILAKSTGTINMLNLAYDSGFNSKSSFYENFKKLTGFSPSDFIELQRK